MTHRASGTTTQQLHLFGGEGPHRRTFPIFIAAFVIALTAASLAAPPASAAFKYQLSVQFTREFNFLVAEDVAVNDKNNHIYVADSGSGQVLNFTAPSDTSPAIWTGTKTPAGSFGEHVSVAVDNSTGDVYVADKSHKVIDKFDENGNLITSFGDTTPSTNGQLVGTATPAKSFSPPGSYYSSFAIAVDQANHDLYVIDAGHKVIDIFDENGAYLRQITASPEGLYRNEGEYALGLTVNSSGTVYASDWGGPNLVFQFDASGNYLRTINGSNTPDGDFSISCNGCYLDPIATQDSTGKLFVGSMEHRDFDAFDSSGNFLPPQGFMGEFGPSGIAVDQATGDLYLWNYGRIKVFKGVVVPDVAINSVSNLTATSATLTGHVDPAGAGNITDCHFEYIDNHDYVANTASNGEADPWTGAKQAPCTTTPPSSLPYSSATDVSANVSGLTPGTYYHVRLVASNSNGSNFAARRFTSVARYVFTTDIGSAGGGSGQLSNPQDVAVENSTGDLYVADTGNHRIVKFDSSGHFVAAWGWGVSDGHPSAEVCTLSCQVGIVGSGAGQFTAPTFIAVDNSTDPSAGDVYVADTANNVVQKFDPLGNLITSWGKGGVTTYSGGIAGIAVSSTGRLVVQPGSGNGIALDSLGNIQSGGTGIAIDTFANDTYYDYGTEIAQYSGACNPFKPCEPELFGEGHLSSAAGLAFYPATGALYAANSGENDIVQFSPIPLPTVSINEVMPSTTSATMSGHVDPHGGGNVIDCHFEYGTDPTFNLGSIPCSPGAPLSAPTDVSAELTGLTPFTTYYYRLVATGANDLGLFSNSRVRTFMPGSAATPSVDATSFSKPTPTTVTLNAQINPNLASTIYRFQYGTDTSYGSHTFPSESIGADGVDHPVSNEVVELQPGTLYHFRVVAVNLNGVTDGQDQTFVTPARPSIGPSVASNVTQTTATLRATVNPGFRATAYHFDYGRSATYGASTPEMGLAGSDNSVHSVEATLSGLTAATTYHFRLVATNAIGTAEGPDETFATAANRPSGVPPPPTCKHGFVKKRGRCVKTLHKRKRRHHGKAHR